MHQKVHIEITKNGLFTHHVTARLDNDLSSFYAIGIAFTEKGARKLGYKLAHQLVNNKKL